MYNYLWFLKPVLFAPNVNSVLLLLFSHTVLSNSLWPHGLQHTRPPCPSSFPKVCPSSCPLHRWCCPALMPSSPQPSTPPSIKDFSNELAVLIRWPNTGASALASVLPMSIQGWFPLILTGLILLSKGLSLRVFCTDLLNMIKRNLE